MVAELLRWPLPMVACIQPKPICLPKRTLVKKGSGSTAVLRRTVFPVFMSRWKGNSDTKAGSVAAAITLESMGQVYPGRLIDTIPLRLCADGRYWSVWEER